MHTHKHTHNTQTRTHTHTQTQTHTHTHTHTVDKKQQLSRKYFIISSYCSLLLETTNTSLSLFLFSTFVKIGQKQQQHCKLHWFIATSKQSKPPAFVCTRIQRLTVTPLGSCKQAYACTLLWAAGSTMGGMPQQCSVFTHFRGINNNNNDHPTPKGVKKYIKSKTS